MLCHSVYITDDSDGLLQRLCGLRRLRTSVMYCTDVCRTSSDAHSTSNMSESYKPTDDQRPTMKPSPRASPVTVRPTPSRLLESGIVLRLEDFALYRVSSAIDERRSTPKKFISSDKKQLLLPKSMSSVHFDFTEYYFPDGKDLPGEFHLPPDTFLGVLQ